MKRFRNIFGVWGRGISVNPHGSGLWDATLRQAFTPSGLTVCSLCLDGGLWGVVLLPPVARTARRAPIGHLGQQRGPPEAGVRVLLLEVGVHLEAAREAVHEVLEEVAAEDHVYPRVAAAVETGEQRGQSHCCVLRL